ELAKYEARWPIGTRQRTAYALMLYVGTARVDVHRMTWRQIDAAGGGYVRKKTRAGGGVGPHSAVQKTVAAAPKDHLTTLNTEYGKPFTVDGFPQFTRRAITDAGLPLDCKPHGLRKTLGRRMAESGCSAHEIMAVLGHTTLAEAERYTREADRRRGGRQAIAKIKNRIPNSQTSLERFGQFQKEKEKP